MAKLIDLTGQCFGNWTVIERDKTKQGTYWLCQCKCGTIKSVRGVSLRNGTSKSCGCLFKNALGDKVRKDLIGERFGRLVVLQRDFEKQGKSPYWLCQCDCGNIKSVSSAKLRNGTQSCGCLQKEKTSIKNVIDLTGKIFNKLTVIERDLSKTGGQAFWKCQCECGNIISVGGYELRNGQKSCGCLQKEQKPNNFQDLTGQVFGKLTVIKQDINFKERTHWLCKCDCGNIKSINASSLKRGLTKSCGCINSKGEVLIENILKELQLRYIKQYTIKDKPVDKLRFDFAIIDNQSKILCIIEYQGIQHYNCVDYFGGQEGFEKQQYRDNLKRQYCKENNIKLIEIPYWDYDNLNKDYILSFIY